MKNIFPGYNKKNEAEIRNIWDRCVLVFDANVLLNLYRYSNDTRQTILKLIGRFSDRIWLPHQAALEYNRNRYEVIADQEKAYKEFIGKINQIQSDLQSTSKPPFLSGNVHQDLNKVFEKVLAEVRESISKYESYLRLDPVYEELSGLFNDKIGEPFAPENLSDLYQKGEDRFKLKIPPGYEDEKNKHGENKYGDWILWKQILAKAKTEKRPLVLVTDERKTDWWWKIKDGRIIGPRQELVEEMKKEAGADFHMYSSEQFLSHGQRNLDEQINQKALKELQAIKQTEQEISSQNERFFGRASRISAILKEQKTMLKLKLDILYSQLSQKEKELDNLLVKSLDTPDIQQHRQTLQSEAAILQNEVLHLQNQLDELLVEERLLKKPTNLFDELANKAAKLADENFRESFEKGFR